jgi:putative DNA methylase
MNHLTPLALKDAPALIETVFPAQKVSYEAQTERKAVQSQTLTGLGSYWKGRKPLILVRAIILGSLLPQTGDAEKDLEIFEKLMAFDDEGLARRAVALGALKPKEIAARIELRNPWHYFKASLRNSGLTGGDIRTWAFPIDADAEGIGLTWRRGIGDDEKLEVYRKVIASLDSYEEKSDICRRPEEVDQQWLYAPVWQHVNRHYADLGIKARSHAELVEQFGILRYGHRPKTGDAFSGGGSIPFEAARLGCDVFASDLNPVACMLTWGALNIVGADDDLLEEISGEQERVTAEVEERIAELGIETNESGDRAKAYLYCQEVTCPETGWAVPLSPTWVVSKTRKVVAQLKPNHREKRFDIEIVSGVPDDEYQAAEKGTAQSGELVYELDGHKYRTPIRTIRGDYRDTDGTTRNRLRRWGKSDFQPRADDVFRERLYAIQWITADTLDQARQDTYFASVGPADLQREELVQRIVAENLESWQARGLVPDMAIESGYNTDQPIRERGWTYWHHFFDPRSLLSLAITKEAMVASELAPYLLVGFAKELDWLNKGCYFGTGAARESISHLFSNQALNVLLNYGTRSTYSCYSIWKLRPAQTGEISVNQEIASCSASDVRTICDIWVTDPPYADAVNYHEITEFFISWLRRDPPSPFSEWIWDSRRALAIKGSGDDFRRGMVDAYRAMAGHMPDNGMQCVMFTHQDTGVWSDMVGIFWAAGLQVVAAWYIATETTSELKKGGYVQGTVILMLRKRPAGERSGFKQRILPAVRTEVERQIESMMHLNDEVKDKLGEPVFNDSDLQMAGYAAALKVLTAYTHIGGDDVTSFALRPRQRGEETVVDEIVQQAAEAANSLLVPEGLEAETWSRLTGIQRFYFRMMDMETTGASKLDNYQNFAKAFRVADYGKVMGNMAANSARLKRVTEFASRDLTDSTEIGPTWLGRLIIGLQQLLAETEPAVVVGQIQEDLPDFLEIRPLLIDMLSFIERKSPEQEVRDAAEVLGGRLKNLRAFSQ